MQKFSKQIRGPFQGSYESLLAYCSYLQSTSQAENPLTNHDIVTHVLSSSWKSRHHKEKISISLLIAAIQRYEACEGRDRFYFRQTLLPFIVQHASYFYRYFTEDDVVVSDEGTSCPARKSLFAQGPWTVDRLQVFTKLECLCVLSNAFLCLFPRADDPYNSDSLPTMNYDEMFSGYTDGPTPKVAKLLMLFDYFEIMKDRCDNNNVVSHDVVFVRNHVRGPPEEDQWRRPLVPITVHP